jgi:hypothetical protein
MKDTNSAKFRLTIQEKTYGIHESGYSRAENHKYLEYENERTKGVIAFVGEILATHYVKNISINKFKCMNQLVTASYYDQNNVKQTSSAFNYKTLTESLRKSGKFNPKEFNLSRYECFWMDVTINAKQQFYSSDETSQGYVIDSTPQKQYGKSFPIRPAIDREGFIVTSFSPQLTKKIQQTRSTLVDTSDQIFEFDWLYKLKDLINDIISLLDITLLQIYTKAQFDPLKSWKNFDASVLGEKHNRRLLDKIKWVKQISGKSPDIEKELASIRNLKEIRNHLNHFDPPTFAVTLEEASEWINQVLEVAFALCKIRKAIGVELSSELINLLLQKKVKFSPEADFLTRKLQDKSKSGYRTSVWP